MRRLAHVLTAAALVVGTGACGGGDDDAATPTTTQDVAATTAARPAPTSTAPPTTSALAPSTTPSTAPPTTPPPTPPPTTVPVLGTPIDPPPEDGSTDPASQIAMIEIPTIGLTSAVWEGIRLSTLDRGPGHWPGTAAPGDPGNVVIAGHRTSHNAEFRDLDELAPGDEVIMSTFAGRFVYRVVRTEVVAPDAMWIIDQTPARTATLFACHPPGSVRERIVAHLELAA